MGVTVNSLFGGAHVYYRSDVFLFSYRGDGVMHCGGEYNASTVVLFSLCQRTAHRILHLVELRTQSAVTFGRREGWILSALRNDLIPSMLKIQKSQSATPGTFPLYRRYRRFAAWFRWVLARWSDNLTVRQTTFWPDIKQRVSVGPSGHPGRIRKTVVLTVIVLLPFALDFNLASIFDTTENFFVEIDHSCPSVQHRYYQQAKWLQHTSPS